MTQPEFATPEPSRRRAGISTIAAVLLGVMLGITADRLLLLPSRDGFGAPPIPGVDMTPAMREAFVRRLGNELQLNDAQRKEVGALIERQYPRMRAAGDSAKAVFERATVEPRAEMMKILTPAQRIRFRNLTGMAVDTLGGPR